jgi:glycosyltransferase involved in cell wall biosynthesis
MNKLLLVSDVSPDGVGGRAEKFQHRKDVLEDEGWDVTVTVVEKPWLIVSTIFEAMQIAANDEVDVVNTVNNPLHLHLAGFVLNVVFGTPWVAEYRDPLVDIPDRTLVTKFLAYVVERLVVLRAERIVWWDGIQLPEDYFEDRYGLIHRVNKTPIGTGFNAATFDRTPTEEQDEFTITYAGSFYDGWIEPYEFFRGLEAHQAVYNGDVQVRFFGDWKDAYDKRAEELGIANLITYEGFVNHAQVVPVLKGSDALLYIGGTDKGNKRNVPSKVMDYIGARRPILAVVDESFRVAELVEEYSLGVVATPDNPDDLANAIEMIRSGAFTYDVDDSVVEQFSRSYRLEYLAGVFNEAHA